MRVAVIGTRTLTVPNLEDFLPLNVSELVSGGAQGVDTCAREYAIHERMTLTEFLPDYQKHGKRAPLIRNELIVDYADYVLAFWDGESNGTRYAIAYAIKSKTPVRIFRYDPDRGFVV